MASGNTLVIFKANGNEPVASNPASPDRSNLQPVLAFIDSVQQVGVFSAIMPQYYTNGTNIIVLARWWAATATTGNGGWDFTFDRHEDGASISDGWATAQATGAIAVPGTALVEKVTQITVTAGAAGTASITKGDRFRFRVRRDISVGSNASGDLFLPAIELREA